MGVRILLGRGTGSDLLERQDALARREALMPEGSWMELSLHSADSFRLVLEAGARLVNGAAELARAQATATVDPNKPVLRIRWRKGQPWIRVVLRVLVPALAGFLLGVVVASWTFYGEISSVIVLLSALAFAGSIVIPVLAYRRRLHQEETG